MSPRRNNQDADRPYAPRPGRTAQRDVRGPGEIRRRDFHAPTFTAPRTGPDQGARQAFPQSENIWRLFIGVELPEEAKAALTGTASQVPDYLRPNVRWSRAEMMHLTLRFLGDTEPDRVEAIKECMSDAAKRSGRFTLQLDDTGAFPDLRQPKVLWVGIKGETDRLQMLHTRLEGALARIDIEPEDRIYNPHLTVGRIQRQVPAMAASQVGQAFAHVQLPDPRPRVPVESLVLYRSRLLEDGPRYEELARASLG